MRHIIIILLLLSLCPISCIDNVPVELPFEEPQLVADVMVGSEPTQSSITIGWSYPVGEVCYSTSWHHPYVVACPPDTSSGPYAVTGKILIEEKETSKTYEFPIMMAERKSYKIINSGIKGIPGYTYKLKIEITYNNKTTTYLSETKMKKTPVIEKSDYVIRKGDIGKSDNYVPLIYFTEPQDTKDYYLFRLCMISKRDSAKISLGGNDDRAWSYSIIDDNFLPAYVNGLSIDDGASVAKYAEFYPFLYGNDGTQVQMFSIDYTTYGFYKSLINQFNNDGGAYSPVPATPKGNISGGAIGIFRALDVSVGNVFLHK